MRFDGEKKSQQVLINVTPSVYELLSKVATLEKRKVGYVARELMQRGIRAVKKRLDRRRGRGVTSEIPQQPRSMV